MDTSDHGLLHPFKSRGVANGLTGLKNALMSLRFQPEKSTPRHLSVSTDENLKERGQANVGQHGVPHKLFANIH